MSLNKLRTEESLIALLKNKPKKHAQHILVNNGMQHLFEEFFDMNIEQKQRQLLAYRSIATKQRIVLNRIAQWFSNAGIEFLVFKGIILSYLLYGEYDKRQAGDIDIYVPMRDYDCAVRLLLENGFRIRRKEGYGEDHHIVFVNGDTVIELHKHIIAPECDITERYLLEHTMVINGMKTFDITATFLHLIYHVYSDTFTTTDMYSLYLLLLQPKRFFLREYELALFAEKYVSDIRWKEVIDDMKKQKYRITFRYLFEDVTRNFPGILPETFLKVIAELDYYETENDIDITKILNGKFSYEKEYIENALSNYIEKNWNLYGADLYKKPGDVFYIYDQSEEVCTCRFSLTRQQDGLQISFEVRDEDISFSDQTFPNVHRTDGIQLFLYGTEKYSCKNIFLFPRMNDGKPDVLPYDVMKRYILKKGALETTLEVFEDGYRMKVILKEAFLQDNHMNHYFYMNVVVCDCDSQTRKRKRTLNLIEQSFAWYNPLYFVKIILEDISGKTRDCFDCITEI